MNKKKILTLAFIIVFSSVYAYLLKMDKETRAQKNIIKFQNEYKEFVEKKYIFDNKLLNGVADATLKRNDLSGFYDEMKTSTFQNIEKQFLNELYSFNFLKGENTFSYTKENKQKHDELLKKGETILKEHSSEERIGIIRELRGVNQGLKNISRLELDNDDKVIKEFKMAEDNQDTQSKSDKRCFRNQSNPKWKLDLEASNKLCNALGLEDCSRYNNEEGETKFNGFSLNNPSALLKSNQYIEYVSLDEDDFRLEFKNKFDALSNNYNIYSEVYVNNVSGKDIYKYNIVAIDKNYIIGCSKPK